VSEKKVGLEVFVELFRPANSPRCDRSQRRVSDLSRSTGIILMRAQKKVIKNAMMEHTLNNINATRTPNNRT
jgi:hypothetical protein